MTVAWGSRIWLVGPAGAGKSTLCRTLCHRLGLPHTELDSLYWRPGWQPAGEAAFLAAVSRVAAADRWVIDGQYDLAHPVLRDRTDMVIWLDPGAPTAFARLVRRTTRRLVRREELWNANRERLSGALYLLGWALRQHAKVRRTNAKLAAYLAARSVPCLRIRSGTELTHLLYPVEAA